MNAKQSESMISVIADSISANKEMLNELDRAIGDGDHGENLSRGFAKALERLGAFRCGLPSEVFKDVAMMLMSAVGGSSGPLFGSFFIKMAMCFKGMEDVSPELFGEAFKDGVNGVISLGKAAPGDKTMLDALLPACNAYRAALTEKSDFAYALGKAAGAAKAGAEGTAPLISRRGRASFLGERSQGHKDPGAASAALVIEAMFKSLSE